MRNLLFGGKRTPPFWNKQPTKTMYHDVSKCNEIPCRRTVLHKTTWEFPLKQWAHWSQTWPESPPGLTFSFLFYKSRIGIDWKSEKLFYPVGMLPHNYELIWFVVWPNRNDDNKSTLIFARFVIDWFVVLFTKWKLIFPPQHWMNFTPTMSLRITGIFKDII